MRSGDRIYAGHLTIEVRETLPETPKRVISFVPQEEERITREATIATSLDKLLGKSAISGLKIERDLNLNTARGCRRSDPSGPGARRSPAAGRALSSYLEALLVGYGSEARRHHDSRRRRARRARQ